MSQAVPPKFQLPPKNLTIGGLLDWADQQLTCQGIEGARRDARLLLAPLLEVSHSRLIGFPEQLVSSDQAEEFAALIGRRCQREPVSRLLGEREFWSLPFGLNAHTLDPRPDTETLVAAVLERIPDSQAPLRLVDLGTGSGCILLALLSELPQAQGVGLDISPDAITQAQDNAATLGLAERAIFHVSNWADALRPELDGGQRFDWVLSNPPYIETADLAGLEPEVVDHDPLRALDGGTDGFDAYREISKLLGSLLAPTGRVALEHGAGQSADLCRLLREEGLAVLDCPADLSGQKRCVIAEQSG